MKRRVLEPASLASARVLGVTGEGPARGRRMMRRVLAPAPLASARVLSVTYEGSARTMRRAPAPLMSALSVTGEDARLLDVKAPLAEDA